MAVGGATGQVLAKQSATDYDTLWTTPLTIPFNQNLLFTADGAYDIGAAAASRPRDLFVGRNAVVTAQLDAGGIRATSTDTPVSGAGLEFNYNAPGQYGYIQAYDRTAAASRDLILYARKLTLQPSQWVDVPSSVRSTGIVVPTSGKGVELFYDGADRGYLVSYDRAASVSKELEIQASTLILPSGSVAQNLVPTQIMAPVGSAVATTDIWNNTALGAGDNGISFTCPFTVYASTDLVFAYFTGSVLMAGAMGANTTVGWVMYVDSAGPLNVIGRPINYVSAPNNGAVYISHGALLYLGTGYTPGSHTLQPRFRCAVATSGGAYLRASTQSSGEWLAAYVFVVRK